MQCEIEAWMALQCLIVGLSHMLQPTAWVEFFVWLRGLGRTGVFLNGLLSLWCGALIVAFHNVWQDWPVLLTLFGWAQVLKASVSLVLPSLAMRGLTRVSPERKSEFVWAGGVFLVLGGLFGAMALTRR